MFSPTLVSEQRRNGGLTASPWTMPPGTSLRGFSLLVACLSLDCWANVAMGMGARLQGVVDPGDWTHAQPHGTDLCYGRHSSIFGKSTRNATSTFMDRGVVKVPRAMKDRGIDLFTRNVV